MCAVCAALLFGISEGRAVCAVNVWWRLVGCASLPALCLAVTPGKRPIKPPLKRYTWGTEWGCLPVPACASLSLFRGRGAGIAAMLRNSGGFVGLPRTIPIASATSLSEYGAVDIDMDLVFCRAAPLRGILVLARKSRCASVRVRCFMPLGVRMCVQALASAGAFQAAPSNLIGPEARYQITLGRGLSAAASIFCLGERGTKRD